MHTFRFKCPPLDSAVAAAAADGADDVREEQEEVSFAPPSRSRRFSVRPSISPQPNRRHGGRLGGGEVPLFSHPRGALQCLGARQVRNLGVLSLPLSATLCLSGPVVEWSGVTGFEWEKFARRNCSCAIPFIIVNSEKNISVFCPGGDAT